MEKLGLGPELLMKENPKLIYARLTGYGQSGYYSNRAGHDINYLGLSGLLSLFGRKNENPIFPANLAADFGGGGLMCAFGILLALIHRSSSQVGQVIDCSMVEGAAYLGSWLFRSQSLPIWGKSRGNNVLDTGAHFYEVYETKDGKYLTVGALEPQFYSKLLEGLGLEEEDVPHFGDFENCKQILKEKFLEKTRDEWCQIFDEIDACVTPVLELEDVSQHRHNADRGSFVKLGDTVVPKPSPVLGGTPGHTQADRAPPQIGEHSGLVLKNLGYTQKEINELVEQGAVYCYNQSKL